MGDERLLKEAEGLSREVGRMIYATLQSLRKRTATNRSLISFL